MFNIEKGVPIPEKSKNRGIHGFGRYEYKYPWKNMDISDSFLVDGNSYVIDNKKNIDNDVAHILMRRMMSASRSYCLHHKDFRFVSRMEGNGVRIWRVPMDYNLNAGKNC